MSVRRYKSDHRNPRRLRYGWRLTASGHITVDPAQRACIFLILRWRRDELTLQAICDALSAGDWPAPRSGAWYAATVRKIIEQNLDLYALLGHVKQVANTNSDAASGAPRRQRINSRRRPQRMHQTPRQHSEL